MEYRADWVYIQNRCGYLHMTTDQFVPFSRLLSMGVIRSYERRVQNWGDIPAWYWFCEQLDWLAFGRAAPCPCCAGQTVLAVEAQAARRCIVCNGTGLDAEQKERRR